MLETLERSWREDSEVFFVVAIVVVTALLITRWARKSVREGRQRQAVRRAAMVLGTLAIAIAGVAIAMGGEDADREQAEQQARKLAAEEAELREDIKTAIRERRLPPVALEMFPAEGEDSGDIIPRPDGDGDQDDVIHLGGDGTQGRKLVFDLDDNGRIGRDEREITESELWSAAMAAPPFEGFGPERRREAPGERSPS